MIRGCSELTAELSLDHTQLASVCFECELTAESSMARSCRDIVIYLMVVQIIERINPSSEVNYRVVCILKCEQDGYRKKYLK